MLERISKTPPELAFRSVNRDLFGFCITTEKRAAEVRSIIEAPNRTYYEIDTFPPLNGEDTIIIVEIGEQFSAGKGFTRLGTWLQRHMT